MIKNLDKEYITFFSKKSAADVHRIICETHGKIVIAIRMCANWFKLFKNYDFDINDKNIQTLCRYERGRIAERWEKIMKNDRKYFD